MEPRERLAPQLIGPGPQCRREDARQHGGGDIGGKLLGHRLLLLCPLVGLPLRFEESRIEREQLLGVRLQAEKLAGSPVAVGPGFVVDRQLAHLSRSSPG